MKKYLITGAVAAATILGSVAMTYAAFTTYLTVGSTGADVTALQSWLINNGYSIPAISSGAAAKGYFGQQTKAAVVAYQAKMGLPATGFVGPLTIAKLNGTATGGVTMTPMTCPAGYTCTPTAGTTTTGGSTVNTGTTGVITTPGIAGSLAVSLQSTPSNGTSLAKGQEADVVQYKLQAGSSDMALTSIALDVNNRLWLYADTITVLDGSTVVAQKSNLNGNDFTELTVGSSYRLNLPVSGYVVPKAGTRYLTVRVHMLPISDRTSATISFTQVQTRAVDGTGVTDTQTLQSTRSFSYTGSNNGQVIVTLNASSPLQGLVQINQSTQTDNVLLAKYDVKSQNIAATLRNFSVTVGTNGRGVTQIFGDIKASINGHTYSADSIATTTTFTNMNEVLPADQYVTLSIYGKINQDTNGTLLTGAIASTTLTAAGTAGGTSNNPNVEDASYSALDVNENTVTSSDLTFSSSSAVLSGLSASTGATIVQNNSTIGQSVSFTFTITAGNNTLYISADPNIALSTSSSGFGDAASTTLPQSGVTANPGTISGDTNVTATGGYYVIPAGSSRTFTFSGAMINKNGANGTKTYSITAVKYGTTTGALTANTINYNLSPLKVSTVL
jgi:peptidoglycan hydrolase-like protein with peptidoglycan-binding domain